MDPVPYEIREEDVDEVLSAHEATGGSWSADDRATAVDIVMRNVTELNETVRTAPEDRRVMARGTERAHSPGMRPGDDSPERRDLALAAIEDLLIRDGFLDVSSDDDRVFPITRGRD